MMSNLCTPWGPFSPKKIFGAKFFPNLLGSGGVVRNFSGNSPWKEVPTTGFKILGAPPKKICGGESKLAQISRFSDYFAHFSKTVRNIENLKNWFVVYGHSSTRWWRNGVLLSSVNYANRTRRHPPSNLFKLHGLARGSRITLTSNFYKW